jgi:hypothetical protein
MFWPPQVRPSDETLLAFVTMIGEQPLNILRKKSASTLLPSLDEEVIGRLSRMSGQHEPGKLSPLQPDLLGELFVLEFMKRHNTGLAPRLVDFAWSDDIDMRGAAGFTDRAVRDFPDHPGLEPLCTPHVSNGFQRFTWATLAIGLVGHLRATQPVVARKVYEALAKMATKHRTAVLLNCQAQAAIHLINDHLRMEDLVAARELYQELSRVTPRLEIVVEEPEQQARLTVNLITALLESEDLSGARKVYNSFMRVVRRFQDRPHLAEFQAQSIAIIILRYIELKRLGDARALYDVLAELTIKHIGIPDVRSCLATSAVALVNGYVQAENVGMGFF